MSAATAPPSNRPRTEPAKFVKPRTDYVLITPEMAREWLAQDENFRRLKPAKIEQFRRDMEADRWQVRNSGIGFDIKGKLVDGFHTLTACVAANTPFRSQVTWDLPEKSVMAIDRGSPRTLSDYLRHIGEGNEAVTLAAVIRMAWLWERGYFDDFRWAFETPTIEEAIDWFQERPSLREGVVAARRLRQPPLYMLPSVSGAFVWRAQQFFPGEAKLFIEKLVKGENMKEGDPILAYRRLLANERAMHIGRQDQRTALAHLLKTFNAWQKATPLKTVTWKPTVEKFPQLAKPVEAA